MAQDERDPESYAIIGAAMDVHNEVGCGRAGQVFDRCAARLFRRRMDGLMIRNGCNIVPSEGRRK